jgi:hypothetical protein
MPDGDSDELRDALEQAAQDADADSRRDPATQEPTISPYPNDNYTLDQSVEVVEGWIARFRARRAARGRGPEGP